MQGTSVVIDLVHHVRHCTAGVKGLVRHLVRPSRSLAMAVVIETGGSRTARALRNFATVTLLSGDQHVGRGRRVSMTIRVLPPRAHVGSLTCREDALCA